MKNYCCDLSTAAHEPLVGTAPDYDVYVLFECPLPWHFNVLESQRVPEYVRKFFTDFCNQGISIRPLLICNEETGGRKKYRVFIYRKVGKKYCGCAFQIDHLEQLPEIVARHLKYGPADIDLLTKQVFVCTHGSRDRCCGKAGYPVYQALRRTVAARKAEVNVWRVSHLGGHRFAATLLSLPEGRYYGRLGVSDVEPFLGSILCNRVYMKCYRGLGALNRPAQVIEAFAWKMYGPGQGIVKIGNQHTNHTNRRAEKFRA